MFFKSNMIETKQAFFDLDIEEFSSKKTKLFLKGSVFLNDRVADSDHSITKYVTFVPNVSLQDLSKYKEEHPEQAVETVSDLQRLLSKRKVVENTTSPRADEPNFNGFDFEIDISAAFDGEPISNKTFKVFLEVEHVDYKENVVYYALVPLHDLKDKLRNSYSTIYYHFTPTHENKYKAVFSYDLESKTLMIKNRIVSMVDTETFNQLTTKTEGRRMKGIKWRFLKLWYLIFLFLPVQPRKVVFASDSRHELNGNLFFVYEELLKQRQDLDVKIELSETINNKKSFWKLIQLAYHFATAKVIVIDDFYPLIYPLPIRQGSELLQVWHAAGAFKTFGFSRMGLKGGPSPRSRNHRNYTKATVSGAAVRPHYAEGFGIDVEKVIPTGIPRADIFVDETYKEFVTTELHRHFPFINGKKVILFAPTFRGNGQSSAFYPYHELDFKALYKEFHEDYVFLFKMHPFVKNKLEIPLKYKEFFHDVSDFREINDLLFITDVLITDYSSVCFEYSIFNKPMIFFAFDLDDYVESRDFYYEYSKFVPGPIAFSTEDIIENIKDYTYPMELVEQFKQKFFDDTIGNASRNVVEQIIIPALNGDNVVEEKDTARTAVLPKDRTELFKRNFDIE